MHATGTSFVSESSNRCKYDARLEQAVDVARQEFSGFSDEEIKAFWVRLQLVLVGWAQDNGETLPQHRTQFFGQDNSPNVFSLDDAAMDEIDFVFLFFLAGQYPPLLAFLQDLAPQPMTSLRKAFALMILRAAAAKNCPEIRRLLRAFERVVH